MPHFTIRMINKLEGLVEEGVLSAEEFERWVDPDMYKEIAKITQQVVSTFKLIVCSDKSMNKTIDKIINNPQPNNYPSSSSIGNVPAAEKKESSETFETYIDHVFEDDMTSFNLK